MGNPFSRMWIKLFGVKKKRVLMGLDNAGKSTLLYRLKYGKVVDTSPTNCFNLESFEHGDGDIIEVWDIGGRWTIRTHFYPNTDGLIFVLDCSDTSRIQEAMESLLHTLKQEDVRLGGAPLLIFLNKLDKLPPEVHEIERISFNPFINYEIDIRKIKPNILVKIQPCSAKTGVGIYQGIDWLCNAMNGRKLSLSDTTKGISNV